MPAYELEIDQTGSMQYAFTELVCIMFFSRDLDEAIASLSP